MNLDLGFEVCFYNGMDAYAKTFLPGFSLSSQYTSDALSF